MDSNTALSDSGRETNQGDGTQVPAGVVVSANSAMPQLTANGDGAVRKGSSTKFWESIPKFNGTENEDVRQFLSTFHMVADHSKWNSLEKLLCLKLKLNGEAAQFVAQNPILSGEKDPAVLEKALRDRFASRECLSANSRKFLDVRQRPSESVRQYAARVQALFYKSVPEEELHLELRKRDKDLLLQTFVRGLLVHLNRLILIQNHKDFEAAKTQAILEEEIHETLTSGGNAHAPVVQAAQPVADLTDRIAQQDKKIDLLAASITDFTSQMGKLWNDRLPQATVPVVNSAAPVAQPAAPVRCFRCQGLGHMSRQCPQGQGRPRYRPPPVQPQFLYAPNPTYQMPYQGPQFMQPSFQNMQPQFMSMPSQPQFFPSQPQYPSMPLQPQFYGSQPQYPSMPSQRPPQNSGRGRGNSHLN